MELLKISTLVFLGGGLGSLARFSLSQVQSQLIPEKFPLGTLIANVVACLLLGLILYIFKDKITSSLWIKYFLVVGFCGGFSTFSTFGFETIQLLKNGLIALAAINIIASLGLGFLVLWLLIKP